MTVNNLEGIPFSEIIQCFYKAFENYFTQFPKDDAYFQERWRKANVNYRYSFGMFDNGVLVGFVLNALGEKNGVYTAYNAATGVLPAYRGKKIVSQIFSHVLPQLKIQGVENYILEVIQENTIAIKTYEREGFRITKHYRCYSGTPQLDSTDFFEVRKLDSRAINRDLLVHHDRYSWEMHIDTIQRGNFSYYEVLKEGKPESYFMMLPERSFLLQFEVLTSEPGAWKRLFTAVKRVCPTFRIINVDAEDQERIQLLESLGLENFLNQYEMERRI
ncbi:GNAT family N-acetyltransferase [Algoriphagus sp. CAU 1675]|uniref:GNAT family N-acetyltransferase n=1 Tax=Algoriphagus sp. CAU 1675 TaxID=3032597 RepID=UPI0023D9EF66|nr:GNAT family N-acetyltransferase [Algoriphagus sp. CAU 1675]MDF2159375.1 GNAT family N-acetyltransferase [Algoriphagus sp. CAU 1675]